ncbi:type I-F CRISPR-associated endoribonuclease Cas6/Csy4 [Vibrio alfacsensis]|uniref:type I-F CRISPR-associated endoribonuclease Cas6/Csy4 n=1 Tax=Vibrio alfacsensis TaxID=1074311 RepID=UPI002ADE7962|nr:type I-F CRISPR-associated endoribonuclease Cas6/Csy4 [Vibrio alfacsensis]WQE78182.1 type I-F CRISPR-associated endoribonuclease Cas6/Csy4 [Vibrio alfacsensis]
MPHFIDIKVSNKIGDVYSNIHLSLVEIESKSIGICLPAIEDNKPGNVIRLIGAESTLVKFLISFSRFITPSMELTDIEPAPPSPVHAVVTRVSPKFSMVRLHRLIKRGTIKASDIPAYKKQIMEEELEHRQYPFLKTKSLSTNKLYVRRIHHAIKMKPKEGEFDVFGMSVDGATIPVFDIQS